MSRLTLSLIVKSLEYASLHTEKYIKHSHPLFSHQRKVYPRMSNIPPVGPPALPPNLDPINTPPAESGSYQFKWNGSGKDYFFLSIKNRLLSTLTFGFYSFQAKVNRRKFLWQNGSFAGHAFDFAGTVKDQLKGIGWLMGVLAVIVVMAGVAATVVHPAAAIPFVYVAVALLYYRMRFGAFRYKARNTLYRGLRGNVAQVALKQSIIQSFKGSFLNVITLGIYSPFNRIQLLKIRWDNTSWGNQKFSFRGNPTEYFKICFKGVFLSLITLGLYAPWYWAARTRYYVNNLYFMDAPFHLEITGKEIFAFMLRSAFLFIVTLGIASSWILADGIHKFLSGVSYEGTINFDQIINDAKSMQKSAADGAGDLVDIDSDFDLAA